MPLLRLRDSRLEMSGFATRSENFLEEMERKKAMRSIGKLTVEGMGEEEVALMVREWREKYKV